MTITMDEVNDYLAAYNRLYRSWTRNRASAHAKRLGWSTMKCGLKTEVCAYIRIRLPKIGRLRKARKMRLLLRNRLSINDQRRNVVRKNHEGKRTDKTFWGL
jgi:hypothetical protein